jgi:ribosomal protein S30
LSFLILEFASQTPPKACGFCRKTPPSVAAKAMKNEEGRMRNEK